MQKDKEPGRPNHTHFKTGFDYDFASRVCKPEIRGGQSRAVLGLSTQFAFRELVPHLPQSSEEFMQVMCQLSKNQRIFAIFCRLERWRTPGEKADWRAILSEEENWTCIQR